MRFAKRAPLAQKLQAVAHKLVNHVHSNIDNLSGAQAMVCAGIAIDKAQLLTGQPTAITEQRRPDLSRLSPEELELYEHLLLKLQGEPPLRVECTVAPAAEPGTGTASSAPGTGAA